MATISSTGIGSGLDVNAIVTQLMSIEARPLSLLQQSKSVLDTKLSAIGQLQSRMSAFRDAANALSSVSLWKQTVARSANEAAVGVSSSNGTASGSYAVLVQSLAAAQTVSSRAFTGSGAALGEGTLTIELGSWSPEPTPTGFTAKAGGSPVTITIGPDDTSLASIRDKINDAGAGVTASIINDASGARLALRSTETGAENAFRVSAAEAVDDGVPGDGLSALAFSAVGATQMARSQTAANATAQINGIDISSASNTLDGVVEGLTLTLRQVTTAPVEVTVGADTDAVRTAIETFVKSFNDVASYIGTQTKYDAASRKGGTLQGDRMVTSLQSQLRNTITQSSTASGVFGSLSEIGIGFKDDGTLELKGSKLDDALGNLPELNKLFATDGADTQSSGFADRFRDLAASILGADGAFETRNDSLKNQITSNTQRQDSMEQRLQKTEARLRAQYQALDAQMAQLSGLSSYLTQQLAAMSNNYLR
ncbi:MAG: flagellar filament capping protein FliD [Rubrivivax sp.]|nr:flagellar filament capping protein FliD [Rubrivivax sp.]